MPAEPHVAAGGAARGGGHSSHGETGESGGTRAPVGEEPEWRAEPPVAMLATRRSPRLRLRCRCRACGAETHDTSTCAACGVATATHAAERDRARRIQYRPTHTKARRLLVDDERRRPVRVSAAQDCSVRDEPEAYAAAVGRNVQRLVDAVVSPDYAKLVTGRDHEIGSYFNVLSFGTARFVNDPVAGIVRTPLPAAQLASFFAGYATQVGRGEVSVADLALSRLRYLTNLTNSRVRSTHPFHTKPPFSRFFGGATPKK